MSKTIDNLLNELAALGVDMDKVKKIVNRNQVQVGKPSVEGRLDWITETDDIQELVRRKGVASSSKSKMKYNADAVARYQAQVDAASERLVQLREFIKNQPTWEARIDASIQLNNFPGSTLDSYVLPALKEKFETAIDNIEGLKELSKQNRKAFIMSIPPQLTRELGLYLDGLGEDILAEFASRLNNNDLRVQTLCRMALLVEKAQG